MSEEEVFSKLVSDDDLEKVSGGLRPADFNYKYEEAIFGEGMLMWGNDLREYVPRPQSKDNTFEYGGVVWTPTYAHIGWHQGDIVWKDGHGNYLVPTGIKMQGMC